MPCKPCAKNRRRPLSPNQKKAQEDKRDNQPARQPSQSFTLRTSDGRTQKFGSRLEAEAAKVRAGGGSIHIF